MRNQIASTDRIRFVEKMSFAMANLGNIPVMALITSFLLIFYTDVVGLAPGAIATLFLITRILDGINDPIMGFVIDHLPRTRLGRFRTYLIIGSVVCSINFILLWFGPLWVPAGKIVIAYITYILIGITFDMMDIPLNSLIPVMTDSEKERSSLSAVKGLFYVIGSVAVSVGAPLVISNVKDPVAAYTIVIFAAVAAVLVFSIIGALGVRERISPAETDQKYRLKDLLPIILSGPVIVTFASALLFGINSAVASSSNLFFFTYVLDNKIELLGVTTLITMVGMLPVMALSGVFVKMLGKKRTYTIGLFIFGLAPLLRLINVTDIPLMLFSGVLGGIGMGLVTPLMYGIQADNVDYVEYTRHVRAEGSLASLNSFVLKAGSGVGGAITGYMLAATGYVANTAQTETAKLGIILNVIVIPAVLMLIASLVFGLGYKIDRKKLTEISQALREKRQPS